MHITRQAKDPREKVLWREKEVVLSRGGFSLDISELKSTGYLKKGAVLALNYSTNAANLIKTAKIVTGGTTSAPRIEKTHELKAGNHVFITVGGLARTISSIDSSNDDYDVLTLDSALTGATANVILIESNATGSSNGAFKYAPNALLNDTTKLVGNPGLTGVISAFEIITANLPFETPSAIQTALKSSSNFMFI